jgi:hypothetical protein
MPYFAGKNIRLDSTIRLSLILAASFYRKSALIVRISTGLVLLASACTVAFPLTSPQGSFTGRSERANGFQLEWSGSTTGYRPEEESLVQINLTNGSRDFWRDGYCILLLDRQGEIETLAREEFTLLSGTSLSRSITIKMPAGLAEDAYGLAFVIPDLMASVTTIWVGEPGDHTERIEWPEPNCP